MRRGPTRGKLGGPSQAHRRTGKPCCAENERERERERDTTGGLYVGVRQEVMKYLEEMLENSRFEPSDCNAIGLYCCLQQEEEPPTINNSVHGR